MFVFVTNIHNGLDGFTVAETDPFHGKRKGFNFDFLDCHVNLLSPTLFVPRGHLLIIAYFAIFFKVWYNRDDINN